MYMYKHHIMFFYILVLVWTNIELTVCKNYLSFYVVCDTRYMETTCDHWCCIVNMLAYVITNVVWRMTFAMTWVSHVMSCIMANVACRAYIKYAMTVMTAMTTITAMTAMTHLSWACHMCHAVCHIFMTLVQQYASVAFASVSLKNSG